MNSFAVKLNDGRYAIIQSCSLNNNNEISARIGVILPHSKCIQFFSIVNWVAKYRNSSEDVNQKLKEIYNKNKRALRKYVLLLVG